jgi:segregation and condensation protein A
MAEELLLDLDGYEGPIDLLLTLAREGKIDLAALSVSTLADQYLAFIAEARAGRIEIAAEYLVMAAWLAYLKSRLLLPREPAPGAVPLAETLAATLAEQLRRLDAMQSAARRLMTLPRLGRDWFGAGAPEGLALRREVDWQPDLVALLKAYGAIAAKRTPPPVLTVDPGLLTSVDAALARLERLVGSMPGWHTLQDFLPPGLRPGIQHRSALAATFVAGLELAKAGRVRLHQDTTFGRLSIEPRSAVGGDDCAAAVGVGSRATNGAAGRAAPLGARGGEDGDG